LDAYTKIVDYLRSKTTFAPLLANYEGTPERCVKLLDEVCLSDTTIANEIELEVKKMFPVERHELGGMITQGGIRINSMCPHHLMPVAYTCYLAYLPQDSRVLGLSKPGRIAKLLGRRAVLHEQLASDIADVLHKEPYAHFAFPAINSAGSAVLLTGVHTCMSCRGVEEDSKTSVLELRGDFWREHMEQKFQAAVHAIKTDGTFR
jgi:GTP cyclohydrolase I